MPNRIFLQQKQPLNYDTIGIFFVFSPFFQKYFLIYKTILKTPILAIFWIQKSAIQLATQILHN